MDKFGKNKYVFGGILIVLFVVMLSAFVYRMQQDRNRLELPYDQFSTAVANEEVDSITYSPHRDNMIVSFGDGREYKVTYPDYEEFRKDMLESGVRLKKSLSITENGMGILIEVVLLIGYIAMFLSLRKGFGKLKARDLVQESGVRFKDIIGLEEILEDISIYVSLIKNPSIGEEIGAKTPKGLLLAGAPGTGKIRHASCLSMR